MKRIVLILACAIAAFHGLGAQQRWTIRARREAAAAQLTATRHAPLPPEVSQYWFVQDVPGASAGEGRVDCRQVSRDSRKAFARSPTKTSRRVCRSSTDSISTRRRSLTTRATTRGVALAGLSRFAEADAVFTAMLASRVERVSQGSRSSASWRRSRWRDRMPREPKRSCAGSSPRIAERAGGGAACARAGRRDAQSSRARARTVPSHLLRQPAQPAGRRRAERHRAPAVLVDDLVGPGGACAASRATPVRRAPLGAGARGIRSRRQGRRRRQQAIWWRCGSPSATTTSIAIARRGTG